ncbi:hypothetical protein QC762_704975 [Podospora pseudocomata]|uniref:Uncharacterized protein n=1 Tax=Podospora pseudocomata TaxID=2093779 RepID=A0ABR0G293_9PEZI|nr:hypothetical protein QC762_704975 [Podospora pseudocomata]
MKLPRQLGRDLLRHRRKASIVGLGRWHGSSKTCMALGTPTHQAESGS